ncbi:MAG: type II toxin-antitoxin system RelE/ParE family toxin [Synergistaceae bacterium]|nr:type II toxin-antitoxin system RelE/ParE family toxin [Synergistaceae bacterium]
MSWELVYLPEAVEDYKNLTRRQQLVVNKAINKVKENPLPQNDGGYGKPLGHKRGINLTGYLKIKLKGEGLIIVYKLIRIENKMLVVVIGVREDEEVYDIALRRIKNLK